MIRIENVSLAYEDTNVLNNISLTVNQGDFIAVVGGNGAGKTTLIKLMNGILKPTEGRVLVSGLDTRQVKASELAKKIGFLFQNPDRQIFQSRIEDEILFGLRCLMTDESEMKKRAKAVMEQFGLRPGDDPFQQSKGQRQRIAFASILAVSPEILILDEPTTGLDYQECMQILNYVKALNEQGTTVIMVSHDMEVVADFSKRVIVVEGGQILADNSFEQVMQQDEVLERSFIKPPQIVGLSKKLGKPFEKMYTVTEMANAVERRRLS